MSRLRSDREIIQIVKPLVSEVRNNLTGKYNSWINDERALQQTEFRLRNNIETGSIYNIHSIPASEIGSFRAQTVRSVTEDYQRTIKEFVRWLVIGSGRDYELDRWGVTNLTGRQVLRIIEPMLPPAVSINSMERYGKMAGAGVLTYLDNWSILRACNKRVLSRLEAAGGGHELSWAISNERTTWSEILPSGGKNRCDKYY